MRKIKYQNENTVFQFNINDVRECLDHYVAEYDVDEVSLLLDFILMSPDDVIKILDDNTYFGFIVLDLLKNGKGSAICKTCNKTYRPNELEPITVGHGESPLKVKFKHKTGIIKKLFKKDKLPGMFGGKGYQCPENHELISMITWIT